MRPHSVFRSLFVAAAIAGCNAITGASDLVVADGEEPALDAGPDAPPAVDATSDAATDAPPVDAGPCPNAIFCDDFELGNLTKWTSLFQTNGGKMTVVNAPVFAGLYAARAQAGPSTPVDGSFPAVGAGARTTIPAVSTGMLVVHARVYMPKTLAFDTTILKVFGTNGIDDMNLKVHNGGLLKVDSDTPDSGAELVGSKAPPVAEWFCLEWQATIGAMGHQKVLVNADVVVDADENDETPGGFDTVQIGFQSSNGSLAQEVLFDDVIIARQPVGCP